MFETSEAVTKITNSCRHLSYFTFYNASDRLHCNGLRITMTLKRIFLKNLKGDCFIQHY